MPTYTFRLIRYPITKTGKCSRCGKTTRRSTTFEQTVNPYNLNAKGEQKTPVEIWAEMKIQAADWGPDFRHEACK